MAKIEEFQFITETKQFPDLVIHSLYTNDEGAVISVTEETRGGSQKSDVSGRKITLTDQSDLALSLITAFSTLVFRNRLLTRAVLYRARKQAVEYASRNCFKSARM